MKLEHSPLFFFSWISEKKSGKSMEKNVVARTRFGWSSRNTVAHGRREGEKGIRRRKGMAERQENGRLKESAGFPLDVKAPIEAVAQRACTPDNDGSRWKCLLRCSTDFICGNRSDFHRYIIYYSLIPPRSPGYISFSFLFFLFLPEEILTELMVS